MIEIPEDGWGSDTPDLPGTLLGGTALAEPSFTVPDWDWSLEPATDPAGDADSARTRAGAVFRRQRSIGAFNRELDTLSAGIAEAPDWNDGLERFDRSVEALRRRHAGDLSEPQDREAFARHAGEFTAMQRIGLKRALVERQVGDALAQLDDQLDYYSGRAAGAGNDVFRQIALDSGTRAIDELQEAGYLTPEAAAARKAAFLGQVDTVNTSHNGAAAITGGDSQSDSPTDEPKPQAVSSEPAPRKSDATETKAKDKPPGFAKAGLIGQRNLDLAMQQGVTIHDMEAASPLPEELTRYQPQPEDSDDTIRGLLKQAQQAAKARGEDVILLIDPSTGDPQLALRPKRSSAHLLSDDVPGASFVNELAVRLDNLARFIGQGTLGAPGGAVVQGKRAFNAVKAGRAGDESILSMGSAGGPSPKSAQAYASGAFAHGQLRPAGDLGEFIRQHVTGQPKGIEVPRSTFDIGDLSDKAVDLLRKHATGFDVIPGRLYVTGRALKHVDERRPGFFQQYMGRLIDIVREPDLVLPNPSQSQPWDRPWLVKKIDDGVAVIVEVRANGAGIDVTNIIEPIGRSRINKALNRAEQLGIPSSHLHLK